MARLVWTRTESCSVLASGVGVSRAGSERGIQTHREGGSVGRERLLQLGSTREAWYVGCLEKHELGFPEGCG